MLPSPTAKLRQERRNSTGLSQLPRSRLVESSELPSELRNSSLRKESFWRRPVWSCNNSLSPHQCRNKTFFRHVLRWYPDIDLYYRRVTTGAALTDLLLNGAGSSNSRSRDKEASRPIPDRVGSKSVDCVQHHGSVRSGRPKP